MTEWLAMGGHGFFIWSSYGMLVLALIVEIAVLRRSRRDAAERPRAMRADLNQP